MKKLLIPLVAIVCITILATIALLNGIDGTILLLAFTVIGGICGYELKTLRK